PAASCRSWRISCRAARSARGWSTRGRCARCWSACRCAWSKTKGSARSAPRAGTCNTCKTASNEARPRREGPPPPDEQAEVPRETGAGAITSPGRGNNMKVRKNALTMSIAIALGMAGVAHAQDASQQQDASPSASATQDAKDLDAVVVTGIRGSIEKAIDAKRHVEVVTSEDVGKLPAKNWADTLRQLPGVNIASSSASEGGFDEADRVSLRGTNPSLTQTLVNGHTIGTGDWFVLSQVANV